MKIEQRRKRSKKEVARLVAVEEATRKAGPINGRVAMIQQLIPIALEAVNEELQNEVIGLVGGESHERTGGDCRRWGVNPGAVCLGGQKVAIDVPRVRDVRLGREVPLETYRELRGTARFDERVFLQMINGISAKRYEQAAELVPETFGISKSSVSRRFKGATTQKLKDLCERDLSGYDIVAMFLDGKHLAEMDLVIALGVTLTGEKSLLGFIETSTENTAVCKDFINGLKGRGLKLEAPRD
jgi:transposase-like protein